MSTNYSEGGTFDIGVYLSTDTAITTSDRRVGEVVESAITAGQTKTYALNCQIPTDLANGTYYWGVIADSGGFVVESNEGNNTGYDPTPSAIPPTHDFTGNWSGTWTSNYYGDSGSISATMTQTGSSLAGKLNITNTDCGDFSNLSLTGSVSGDEANFQCAATCPLDGSYNELHYTHGRITGNTMTGDYTVYSNGSFLDSGTFSVTRQDPFPASCNTTGVFRPWNGVIYLKNQNTEGYADVTLNYGLPGDKPIAGDWDGDGITTIGVYRDGVFLLRNSNTNGFADIAFSFGEPGDLPVAGDWDGDGIDTIGIYRNGLFMLRNSNSTGPPEMQFVLGVSGDVPIAGDWTGKGYDTAGVFRPSNGALYLKNTNETGYADLILTYGLPGDKPVVGDWDGDGIDTIGVHRNGTFMLRNSNTNGFADIVFSLGMSGDEPISGHWGGEKVTPGCTITFEGFSPGVIEECELQIDNIIFFPRSPCILSEPPHCDYSFLSIGPLTIWPDTLGGLDGSQALSYHMGISHFGGMGIRLLIPSNSISFDLNRSLLGQDVIKIQTFHNTNLIGEISQSNPGTVSITTGPIDEIWVFPNDQIYGGYFSIDNFKY
jgi:hypothetical protein